MLSSPCNGEGRRVAVEGLTSAEPSDPSVSSPSASIHLPTRWGGDAASAALRCAPEGRLVLRHRLALHGFLGRGGAGRPAEGARIAARRLLGRQGAFQRICGARFFSFLSHGATLTRTAPERAS